VITDGDITVAESGAIIEYLVERYDDGRLAPRSALRSGSAGATVALRRGIGHDPLLIKLICDQVAKAPMPFFARPVARAISAKVQAMTVEPN